MFMKSYSRISRLVVDYKVKPKFYKPMTFRIVVLYVLSIVFATRTPYKLNLPEFNLYNILKKTSVFKPF